MANKRFGWRSGSVHSRNVTVENQLTVRGAPVVGTLPMVSGDIWYVNPNLSKSGDGKSMQNGFKTFAEALSMSGNYDTILIAEASIQTLTTTQTITQTGLKIIGSNSVEGTQSSVIKMTGNFPMFTIKADRVEIANLCLSQRTAYACIQIGDAAGQAYYQTYIHNCNFDGYDTATYAISPGPTDAAANDQCDPVNLVVEDCFFKGHVTATIVSNGTRDCYRGNTINVYVDGIGISHFKGTGDRNYSVITDNSLFGLSSTTTKGILFAATPTAGTLMLARNYLCGTWNVTITDVGGGCNNYVTDASGGALINC